MQTALSYIDYIFITASSYPMVIQIAIFFIFFNTILGLFLFLNMIRIRRKKKNADYRTENIQSKAEQLFNDLLQAHEIKHASEIIESYETRVEKLNSNSIDTICGALENIVLNNRKLRQSENFLQIIDTFDVLNHLEDHMSSFSTKKRLDVFQMLSNLELTVSDSNILPHTYSKKKSIKKSSRTSYIAVSKNDPFKFFETNRETELNEWDQISLMQQFETHHKDNLPDFSKWIRYTKQKTQIVFFVRMAAHFNQSNSMDTIADLLNNEDHDIRKEAISALGKLNYATIEPKLMKMFYSQPDICQKAIIQTVTIFQTGAAFDFLKNAYESAASFESKLLLAEALYLYKPYGLQYFKNKIQKEEGFNKLILQHVQNPLIKSEFKDVLSEKSIKPKRRTKVKLTASEENEIYSLPDLVTN